MAEAPAACARVFFALWPTGLVRRSLASAAHAAQAECGGRAMADEKLHMTLFFVGQIERSRVGTLKALGTAIVGEAVELDVDTMGYWRHNRIVWAGARRCPSPLSTLVKDLERRLAFEGITAEERPYTPHVTLVRNANRAPEQPAITAFRWRAEDFVLVESVPARGGVRYDVIGRWRLAGLSHALPEES